MFTYILTPPLGANVFPKKKFAFGKTYLPLLWAKCEVLQIFFLMASLSPSNSSQANQSNKT